MPARDSAGQSTSVVRKQVTSLNAFLTLDTTCCSQLLAKHILQPSFLSVFTEINAGGGGGNV